MIVAYHRPESLGRLVGALDRPGIEVVVVNVEEDDSVSQVVADRPGCVEVPVAGNPGYAAAVNAGVARSSAAIVAFMNDDVDVSAGSLDILGQTVASGAADVAVPRVIDGRGQLERTIAPLPTPGALAREWLLLPDHPVSWLRGRVRVEKWRAPVEREVVPAASAMLVVTRREVLTTHPLPEAYFLYWEESEWFSTLAKAGMRVVYEPAATCVHAGGRDDVRIEKSRLMARNAVRCIRRSEGWWAALVAYPVVVAWNVRLVATAAVRAAMGRPGRELLAARVAGLLAAVTAVVELRPAVRR